MTRFALTHEGAIALDALAHRHMYDGQKRYGVRFYMMLDRRTLLFSSAATLLAAPFVAQAQNPRITQIASGFDAPWAIGFLPGGGVLVTERDGALIHLKNGKSRQVAGLPRIAADGQGGLLDVLVPRGFTRTRQLFFTYAKPQGRGSGTAVLRARLSADGARLEQARMIFEIAKGSSGGRHFGSRLVEARDGALFVTVGDRGDRPSAQDRANHNGSILRITKNGAPAPGNPFIGQPGIQPEIWSFGHRNPQGLAIAPDGQLWAHEHGARGGDEINPIRKGANYGWPVIAYGRHYSGRKIGEGTAKPGMEQPAHFWDPSIAPSGYAIHSRTGDHYVGSLKFDYIARLRGTPLREVEQIQTDATSRVRDVREAPDGSIWFLSVGNGALYRMTG